MALTLDNLAINFQKLQTFESVAFRRWQKKMHFLLVTLNLAYVLNTPKPLEEENESLETTRHRIKWENDDYICRGHILNGMSDFLFDIYQHAKSAKELWNMLESKHMMAENASSKKFLVSEFDDYKMAEYWPIAEQLHELQRILGQTLQHKMHMDESITVAFKIDKLLSSWKDLMRDLKRDEEGQTSGTKRTNKCFAKSIKHPKFHKSKKAKNNACWECGGPHFKRDCPKWKKMK